MTGFNQMTDEYKMKRYPEGYFAKLAKGSGGLALVICGAVPALIGIWLGSFLVGRMTEDTEYPPDTGVIIFIAVVALILLAIGILIIVFGVKRMRMGKRQWMEKCVKASDYPMEVVEDFDSQFMKTDATLFQLDSSGLTNVLTTDYILYGNLLGPCLIKLSDIVGVYLVCLPDTITVGNKIKKITTLNVAVFSNHKTWFILPTKEKLAHQLIDLIAERNSSIDTADRRVLDEEEYQGILKVMKMS